MEVSGELDLDSGNRLRDDLLAALARSACGLELDLSRLDFCDCAGLGILMDLRQRAERQGKTVFIGAGSPAVDRLLSLIGAQEFFAPPGPRHAGRQPPGPATAPSPTAGTSPGATSPRSRADRHRLRHDEDDEDDVHGDARAPRRRQPHPLGAAARPR
ncbi:STAS domain-containing protein [Streptomyces sp. NPDC052109]|uniref:STAS domain-containing protein n=1 Tax=Streptomyces sp. NPDC052109 TaxID=3155527 RepID=UPI0034266D97